MWTQVLRLAVCRSIISLIKITHQIWRNHPFSQNSKTIERAVGVEVVRNGERGEGLAKLEKRGLGNIEAYS